MDLNYAFAAWEGLHAQCGEHCHSREVWIDMPDWMRQRWIDAAANVVAYDHQVTRGHVLCLVEPSHEG